MKRFLLLATILATSISGMAQYDDADWQTGGGYPDGEPTGNGYSYDRPYEYDHRSQTTTLFTGGHQDAPVSVTIGYVNKQWETDFGNRRYKESFWGAEGRFLHGVQIGFGYQPALPWGGGIRTGIYYEAYISQAPEVHDNGFDDFTEHNFYIPLHLMYRFPITRNISFQLYGGVAMNWAFASEYTNWDRYDHYYDDHYFVSYDSDGFPKRLNLQGELGAALRFGSIQFNATYALGFTNHEFYPKENSNRFYKTTQNKLSIGISFVM